MAGSCTGLAASGRLGRAFGRCCRSSRGIRALVIEGVGTPAPAAPTERLVVGGLYRYVRNPMYLAVAAVIVGQAAVLGRWLLVGYALVFGGTVWSFVHWYEEPTLRRQFGAAYEEYRATVPGWWLRRPRDRRATRLSRK
jgi:protein-S-isoprenylcysteine O-methyltransferase Ste14